MAQGIPFGHFLLARRLARGGMAEVFLARQSGLEGFDRRVAVKRILPHLSERPDFVKMFLDEARLAARLSHPNIAHIYEFGKVDEDYFIAMEYVDGVHAGQLIKKGIEPMPHVLVARIGADAASALAYAHRLEDVDGTALQVVHRDISPPNLLISFDGVVKIVDFGIAKAAAIGGDQTQPGVVKGKYAYMSPEQTVGRSLDGRSDVFSLALVLWELLAGRHVVDRRDPAEAMRSIRDGRFPAIEQINPSVPAGLAAAIGQALTVDREERSTAEELGVALEAFMKSSPELATSMHLADWIRVRFPRTSTQSHAALPPPDRRSGTVVAPPTGASRAAATPVTRAVSTIGSTPAPALALPPREATFLHTALAASDVVSLDDVPDASGEDVGDFTDVVTLDDRTALVTPTRATPVRRRRVLLWIVVPAALALAAVIGMLASSGGGTPGAVDAGARATPPVTPRDAGPTVIALAPDAAPVPDATPVPRAATLDVVTTPPGATIRLAGRTAPTQRSPATFLDLEPGDITVEVELDGHEPLTRELRLAGGERRTLDLELTRRPTRPPPPDRRRAPGTLNVRTDPYSVVYDGKKKLGETPFVRSLPAGTYTLRFVNPDRPAQSRKVTIAPGKTTKLRFSL